MALVCIFFANVANIKHKWNNLGHLVQNIWDGLLWHVLLHETPHAAYHFKAKTLNVYFLTKTRLHDNL